MMIQSLTMPGTTKGVMPSPTPPTTVSLTLMGTAILVPSFVMHIKRPQVELATRRPTRVAVTRQRAPWVVIESE